MAQEGCCAAELWFVLSDDLGLLQGDAMVELGWASCGSRESRVEGGIGAGYCELGPGESVRATVLLA